MSFALRLKAARDKSKMSLQALADAVGASKAHIWELEIGKSKNPSLELVTKLAQALKVTVTQLVGETPSDLDQNPEAAMAMFRDFAGLQPHEQELIQTLMAKLRTQKQSDGSGQN